MIYLFDLGRGYTFTEVLNSSTSFDCLRIEDTKPHVAVETASTDSGWLPISKYSNYIAHHTLCFRKLDSKTSSSSVRWLHIWQTNPLGYTVGGSCNLLTFIAALFFIKSRFFPLRLLNFQTAFHENSHRMLNIVYSCR